MASTEPTQTAATGTNLSGGDESRCDGDRTPTPPQQPPYSTASQRRRRRPDSRRDIIIHDDELHEVVEVLRDMVGHGRGDPLTADTMEDMLHVMGATDPNFQRCVQHCVLRPLPLPLLLLLLLLLLLPLCLLLDSSRHFCLLPWYAAVYKLPLTASFTADCG